MLALLIATGSSLQCLTGRALIERWLPGAKSLEIPERVVPLLLLGGPAACLVASLIGSLSVLLVGHHAWSTWGFSFWSWWVGDTIGVLLFTPVVLLLAKLPEPEWRQQALTIIGPSLTLLVLVVALFFQSSAWENQRIESSFRTQARTVVENLQRDIDRYEEAVASLHRLFRSSSDVTPAEFRNFTQPLIARNPAIQAMEFVPRITAAERPRLEEQAHRDGLRNFRIREYDAAGNLVPAGIREEYFPVYLVEPLAGNEAVVGFDLASSPARRATLQQARNSGLAVATPRLTLINNRRDGLLLMVPLITQTATGEQLQGAAMGVFLLDTLVHHAMPDEISQDIVIRITDLGTPTPDVLFRSGPEAHHPPRLQWTVPLRFADRLWRLDLSASEVFIASQRSSVSWLVLAGGLLFTGVLQMLLLTITGHARSISQQVALRTQQLTASEARLRAIFNDNPDAILVVNAQGRIVGTNTRTQTLFDYTPEALDQATVEVLLPERFRERHRQHRSSYFQNPQLRAMGAGLELYGRRSDGSEFPVDVMLSPMHLPDQSLVIVIVCDITERHRLQRAREESETRFRAVAESASDALLSANAAGNVVYANPATEQLFGYPAARLPGMSIQELLPGQALPGTPQSTAAGPTHELLGCRANGSRFPCELSSAGWTVGGEQYFTLIVRDITLRRLQEERLGNMLQEKETLLKEVYHRVKNNLQVIQSLPNLEGRTLPEGVARTALDDTSARVRAMALVHEKLYQSSNLSRISLKDYVGDLESRGIRLSLEITGNPEAGLDTAISLGLLLNELLSNSIKHGYPSGRKGHIRVCLRPGEGGTEINVTDDGVGLPAGFDPQRATTMGLKLAVRLARQLGGQLETESTDGTCFHALLQLH